MARGQRIELCQSDLESNSPALEHCPALWCWRQVQWAGRHRCICGSVCKGVDKLPPPAPHYLFTTNAFSIHSPATCIRIDCFLDTSEKRVDGIDVLGHQRQQTSDKTAQAELPRRETRRVPLDVADCAVRAIDKAAVGRSVHRCPPSIFVITKAIAVPIRRAIQSAVDPSCRLASGRPRQALAARQSRQPWCSAWIPRPHFCLGKAQCRWRGL